MREKVERAFSRFFISLAQREYRRVSWNMGGDVQSPF